MKKIICFLLCIAILTSTVVFVSSADENEGIAPCLNNTDTASTHFFIEDGVAWLTWGYMGYPGITAGATVTSKIQKRFLLVFWRDVDNGMPNNEWVDVVTGEECLGEHSLKITDTGTYRSVVQFEIRGSGGAADVLESKVEFEYN